MCSSSNSIMPTYMSSSCVIERFQGRHHHQKDGCVAQAKHDMFLHSGRELGWLSPWSSILNARSYVAFAA